LVTFLQKDTFGTVACYMQACVVFMVLKQERTNNVGGGGGQYSDFEKQPDQTNL